MRSFNILLLTLFATCMMATTVFADESVVFCVESKTDLAPNATVFSAVVLQAEPFYSVKVNSLPVAPPLNSGYFQGFMPRFKSLSHIESARDFWQSSSSKSICNASFFSAAVDDDDDDDDDDNDDNNSVGFPVLAPPPLNASYLDGFKPLYKSPFVVEDAFVSFAEEEDSVVLTSIKNFTVFFDNVSSSWLLPVATGTHGSSMALLKPAFMEEDLVEEGPFASNDVKETVKVLLLFCIIASMMYWVVQRVRLEFKEQVDRAADKKADKKTRAAIKIFRQAMFQKPVTLTLLDPNNPASRVLLLQQMADLYTGQWETPMGIARESAGMITRIGDLYGAQLCIWTGKNERKAVYSAYMFLDPWVTTVDMIGISFNKDNQADGAIIKFQFCDPQGYRCSITVFVPKKLYFQDYANWAGIPVDEIVEVIGDSRQDNGLFADKPIALNGNVFTNDLGKEQTVVIMAVDIPFDFVEAKSLL